MSKEMKMTLVKAIKAIILIVTVILAIKTVHLYKEVQDYRFTTWDKYCLYSCEWYEKPVFYDHEVKQYWDDETGYFIVQGNVFTDWIGDSCFYGIKYQISYADFSKFIEMQTNLRNHIAFLTIATATLVFLSLYAKKAAKD